jgi:hypothetical protein
VSMIGDEASGAGPGIAWLVTCNPGARPAIRAPSTAPQGRRGCQRHDRVKHDALQPQWEVPPARRLGCVLDKPTLRIVARVVGHVPQHGSVESPSGVAVPVEDRPAEEPNSSRRNRRSEHPPVAHQPFRAGRDEDDGRTSNRRSHDEKMTGTGHGIQTSPGRPPRKCTRAVQAAAAVVHGSSSASRITHPAAVRREDAGAGRGPVTRILPITINGYCGRPMDGGPDPEHRLNGHDACN